VIKTVGAIGDILLLVVLGDEFNSFVRIVDKTS
jgi:hypothetical protein